MGIDEWGREKKKNFSLSQWMTFVQAHNELSNSYFLTAVAKGRVQFETISGWIETFFFVRNNFLSSFYKTYFFRCVFVSISNYLDDLVALFFLFTKFYHFSWWIRISIQQSHNRKLNKWIDIDWLLLALLTMSKGQMSWRKFK